MSTRDIQAQVEELYGVELSPTLISNVTESVQEEVKRWQNRPLEAVYPILYLDALMVKVRENGVVKNKAVYLALAVTLEGKKELLGLWVSQSEGAKFWLGILTELRQRGVKDILIACVDGLTGFPEAIESVFPQTMVQLCIVHLVRRSLRFVNWKVRKTVAAALREIYTAPTRAALNWHLMPLPKRGMPPIRPLANSGAPIGNAFVPFSTFPLTFVGRSTPPMRSRVSTTLYVRCSKPKGLFPVMRRFSNFFFWPYSTSWTVGPCPFAIGKPLSIILLFILSIAKRLSEN